MVDDANGPLLCVPLSRPAMADLVCAYLQLRANPAEKISQASLSNDARKSPNVSRRCWRWWNPGREVGNSYDRTKRNLIPPLRTSPIQGINVAGMGKIHFGGHDEPEFDWPIGRCGPSRHVSRIRQRDTALRHIRYPWKHDRVVKQHHLADPTASQALIGTAPPATGSFVGLSGSVGIDSLNISPAMVGSPFTAQTFLSDFSAEPALQNFLVNYISSGIFGSGSCSASPMAGQLCTPSGSPFNFQNNPGGGSTLSFALSGVTSDGDSAWDATFTSQFTTPYQTQLAADSFSNSYSANFTVTPTAATSVPEPITLSLFGAGLAGAVAMRRRKKTDKTKG